MWLHQSSPDSPTCHCRQNTAEVLPLVKKPANYRPISNGSTVSKVLERLMLAHLWLHLLSFANFSQFQSAYSKGHSTETALLNVLDGAFTAAVDKHVTLLIGLDLSAAFDTVDHELLLARLQAEFGVSGTVLIWLQSYPDGRTQFVKIGQHQLTINEFNAGIPRGTVLGPLLFAI